MDVYLLLVVLAFLLVGFVLERMPVDVTSFLGLGLLLLFGLVTPEEATAGFSNPAVVTVMMMFILSEGLVSSGIVRQLGYRLLRLAGRAERRASAALLTMVGGLSAFINNTAAVSIFLPLGLDVARHYRISPSKLLIPLSYAAIFGGTCTLIGTSTNILVSSLAVANGQAPFGMFELFRLGGILFVVGLAFNLLAAPRLLPDRSLQESLTAKYQMGEHITELRLAPGSDLLGKTVLGEELHDRYRISVLEILRGRRKITADLRHTTLEEQDVLLVRGRMEDILAFKEQRRLLLLTDFRLRDDELADESNVLVELQLDPTSELTGASLREIDFRKRYGCFVLALNRTGELIRDEIHRIALRPWDTLLVFGPRQRIEGLAASRDFMPLQELDIRLRPSRRWWIGAATIPLVVLLAALGVTSILKSAILGVALLLATGTLRIQQAYKAIDWTVIFLLATILPVGTAMVSTGLAQAVGEAIVRLGEPLGPAVVLSLVILVTSLLTEVITNNSAAVLMVPIAVSIAEGLGVDARPFLMGVTFAASMSFATPTGYQTNTMVYGPGGYRFVDFLKIGVPLNLLFWILASLLIPLLWPL